MDAYDAIITGTGAGTPWQAPRAFGQARPPARARRRWPNSTTSTSSTSSPSIGAVNPALTAIANALRVGDHLLARLA